MSAVSAILVMLLIMAALIAFCIVNAVRIIRDMNKMVATFRTRLEDEANSVLEGLFQAHQAEDGAGRSANDSQPTTSD